MSDTPKASRKRKAPQDSTSLPTPSPSVSRPEKKPDQLSEEELSELDRFCRNTMVEECGYETWVETHQNLDILLPVWLGCQTTHSEVTYTYSYKETQTSAPEKRKEKVFFDVPSQAKEGARLRMPHLGDQLGRTRGDLILILNFRKRGP